MSLTSRLPLPACQACFATAAAATRSQVLLGTHARVGRDSQLRRLPLDALSRLLDCAAPRAPCQLSLSMQQARGAVI